MKIKLQKIGETYLYLKVTNNTDNKIVDIARTDMLGQTYYLEKKEGKCKISYLQIKLGTRDSEYMFENLASNDIDNQFYQFTELLKMYKETTKDFGKGGTFEIEI